MNIKETFLNLTTITHPYGTEKLLEEFLPKEINKDEFGNYYIIINESRTMFTCHLDNADWHNNKINHIFEDNFIKTDGKTILGADDKAGATILLYMIYKNVPGTYYFFLGEERGMTGSKAILNIKKQWFIDNFDRCISFDRREYGSIITNQLGMDCCSHKFADALAKEYKKQNLKHKKDPTGIYTDSAAFIYTIPECTNISVGYFSEHSNYEKQDIKYLEKLSEISIKIDWENLPTIGIKNKKPDYYYKDEEFWI